MEQLQNQGSCFIIKLASFPQPQHLQVNTNPEQYLSELEINNHCFYNLGSETEATSYMHIITGTVIVKTVFAEGIVL